MPLTMRNSEKDLIERHRTLIGLSLVAVIVAGSTVSLYTIHSQNQTPEISLRKNADVSKTLASNLKSASSSKIKVHIAGAVNNPGVIEINSGSRVEEALDLAGGLSKEADIIYVNKDLNLARNLSDGDKIFIPAKGEILSAESSSNIFSNVKSDLPADQTSININTASVEEILAANLYRIGPKTAGKIVEYREQYGAFKSIEEIMDVSGIGEKTFEKIKGRIAVE